MTFTYTYRDSTGVKREVVIEANSRAEIFSTLRSQGISPISVKEGGKPRNRSVLTGGSNSHAFNGLGKNRLAGMRIYQGGLLIVLVVLGGVLWWHGHEKTSTPDVSSPTIKKPQPSPVGHTQGEKRLSSSTETERTEEAIPPSTGKIKRQPQIVPPRPKPSWPPPPVQRDEHGRVIPPPGAITLDSQKSTFRRDSDSYIAMLISSRPGEPLPPMPQPGPAIEEDFLASLKEPIEIGEDDSPEDKAMKFAVMAAREEIKKQLDAGANFADIVSQHEALLKDNNEIREKALSEYHEILKSGDEKGAEKYFKMINIALQQMGVPPMEKSTSHEAIRARMLEARMKQEKDR